MYISARVDYAVRSLVVLAGSTESMRGEEVAAAQGMPTKTVINILVDLGRLGFVQSRRGPAGGFRLAQRASDIAIADVVRALEGPLAEVNGVRPDELDYEGVAAPLRDVWVALRASMRQVLESTTIADVAKGRLSPQVRRLLKDDDAYAPRRLGPPRSSSR